MCAATGLSAIGAAFVAVALVLAVFAVYTSLALIGAVYALAPWAMSVRYGARTSTQGIGLGADALADLNPPRGSRAEPGSAGAGP